MANISPETILLIERTIKDNIKKDLNAREKVFRVLMCRLSAPEKTLNEIATECGYTSRTSVSKWIKKDWVQSLLETIRAEIADEALWTREQWLKEHMDTYNDARKEIDIFTEKGGSMSRPTDLAAANKALDQYGKAQGFYQQADLKDMIVNFSQDLGDDPDND